MFYNEVSLHRKERNNCSIHLFFSLGGVDPFFFLILKTLKKKFILFFKSSNLCVCKSKRNI